MGFTDPTPIQLRAFPVVLAGKDLIGRRKPARQDSGVRAPDPDEPGEARRFRCLVLEPTRELAAQVETAFSRLRALH
jgi:ATP-dependent RNA helicase RhlE